MWRFNIDDYMKWKKMFINTDILVKQYDLHPDNARKTITRLLDDWMIVKLTKWNYIFINALNTIQPVVLATILDPNCYIGLYNVLERTVIKQWHTKIFALSNNRIVKNENVLKNKRIEFINIKIPQTFWIEMINNIRYSDNERSLLDLIYLHVFTWYPITSELYLKWNLDEYIINDYLKYYPKRVEDFYFNKLHEYAKQ